MRFNWTAAQRLLNILIIVLVVVLVASPKGTVLNRSIIEWWSPPAPQSALITTGAILPPFPGINWSDAQRNVVLVTSETCPYCQASLDFHSRLGTTIGELGDTRLIVVSNDPEQQLRAWLSGSHIAASIAIHVDDANLATIGIFATPTLITLDGQGRVMAVWYGQLKAEEEVNATSLIRAPANNPLISHGARLAEINENELSSIDTLLDVGNHDTFTAGQTLGTRTLNIPHDEITVRLADVPRSGNLAIDCRNVALGICRSVGLQLVRQRRSKIFLLR